MSKFKVLDENGLATLTAFIKQVKKTSDGNTSDVSDLREDLQELTSQLAAVLSEVGDCIETLDSDKAYIAVRKELSLTVDGWAANTSDDAEVYPFAYTFPVTGLTAETRADAVLDSTSSAIAGLCGMSPTTETVNGGVIFKTRTKPNSVLTGQLYITQGSSGETTA